MSYVGFFNTSISEFYSTSITLQSLFCIVLLSLDNQIFGYQNLQDHTQTTFFKQARVCTLKTNSDIKPFWVKREVTSEKLIKS